ncbi:hypothetical protein TruAng_004684 [Truncatella angustata]|nr:hypothetical protein TruAng_004684 [Truncatella angustata]
MRHSVRGMPTATGEPRDQVNRPKQIRPAPHIPHPPPVSRTRPPEAPAWVQLCRPPNGLDVVHNGGVWAPVDIRRKPACLVSVLMPEPSRLEHGGWGSGCGKGWNAIVVWLPVEGDTVVTAVVVVSASPVAGVLLWLLLMLRVPAKVCHKCERDKSSTGPIQEVCGGSEELMKQRREDLAEQLSEDEARYIFEMSWVRGLVEEVVQLGVHDHEYRYVDGRVDELADEIRVET